MELAQRVYGCSVDSERLSIANVCHIKGRKKMLHSSSFPDRLARFVLLIQHQSWSLVIKTLSMFASHQTCLASLILSITSLAVGATPLGADPRYGGDPASSFSARGFSNFLPKTKTSTETEAVLKLIGFASGYTNVCIRCDLYHRF